MLRKVSSSSYKKYKFVLFNDLLLYGSETLRGILTEKNRRYKIHRKIPLEEVRITHIACACHDVSFLDGN